MKMVVEGPGNRVAILRIRELDRLTNTAIRQGFFALGEDLLKETRQSIIKGPKTGRLYRIKGRKRRHRASAPGEPPANRTGNLQKSVGYNIQGANLMEFGFRDSAPYGKFTELGTVKMKKRPALKPAVDKNERNARSHFESQLQRRLTQ